MENTVFVGKVRLDFDQLPSTNDYLSEMAVKTAPPEGTMVTATQQSKGKGQQGNAWFTGEGANLAISFFFKPTFVHPSHNFLLTQTFGLGVLDALREFNSNGFSLKWPNDLYYEEKKVGGMLIETSIQGQRFSHCILGIGLNVNQHFFPTDLPNPISLFQILKKEIEKEQLIERLAQCIEKRYLQLRRGAIKEIDLDYQAQLYLLGQKRAFLDVQRQKSFWAKIKGVDENGILILEKMNGKVLKYGIKEVKFL